MTRSKHRKYHEFVDRIDLDAVEDSLNLRYIDTSGPEDRFYCHDAFGLHQNGDRTGKLNINREKRLWKCWVCGGGNLISLVMAVFDWDAQTATDWLYQFTTEEHESHDEWMAEIDSILYPEEPKAPVLPYFNENALLKWSTSHVWFDDRRIADFFRRKYYLGYDPSHVRYAPRRGGEYIDEPYVGPAIILPHFWHGQLVGWQARWLDPDRPKWVPKYTGTPDFPSAYTLFNWDNCEHQPIIVESVPTALFLVSEGYEAIATFGAGVHEEQIKLLRVFREGVFLAPDHDHAGEKWFKGLSQALEPYIRVGAIGPVNGEGGDLGDLSSQELHTHLQEQRIWL